MTTRIVRIGNTLSVEIPEELVTEASLPVGEPVEWISNGDGTISLVPQDSPEHRHIRAGLAELAAGQSISNERVMEWLDSWARKPSCPLPNEDSLVPNSGFRPEVNSRIYFQGQPYSRPKGRCPNQRSRQSPYRFSIVWQGRSRSRNARTRDSRYFLYRCIHGSRRQD